MPGSAIIFSHSFQLQKVTLEPLIIMNLLICHKATKHGFEYDAYY